MKFLICLLATIVTCNATFLSLLGGGGRNGGKGGSSNTVVAMPSRSIGHGHGGGVGGGGGGHGPQVYKVILQQAPAPAPQYHQSYSGNGHTQIIKVIHETVPSGSYGYGSARSHDHGYSSYGGSSSGGYSHGSSAYSSQLNEILPQILQLILAGDGGSSSGGAYNGQLIDAYGLKGRAIVRSGKSNDQGGSSYFNSGHVVEKGTLQITRVEDNANQSQDHGSFKGGASGGAGNGGIETVVVESHPSVSSSSGWSK